MTDTRKCIACGGVGMQIVRRLPPDICDVTHPSEARAFLRCLSELLADDEVMLHALQLALGMRKPTGPQHEAELEDPGVAFTRGIMAEILAEDAGD